MPKRISGRPADADERRHHKRLPIEREVRYKVLGTERTGRGKTIDMRSAGVLFTTASGLMEGDKIELVIDWPVQLEGRLRLKMVMFGRVVRAEEKQAAITISRYSLRTRAAGDL